MRAQFEYKDGSWILRINDEEIAALPPALSVFTMEAICRRIEADPGTIGGDRRVSPYRRMADRVRGNA